MEIERLSKNFTFYELTRTDFVEHLEKNKMLARHPAIVRNLKSLCNELLQEIRNHFDSPCKVTSGFRYYDLNKTVGGSENSQHLHGEAADFYIQGFDNEQVFNWIKKSGLCFGQLILEPSWIHISLAKYCSNFNECFIAKKKNGKTIYERV